MEEQIDRINSDKRKFVGFIISKKIYERFRDYCRKNGWIINKAVEKLMEREMESEME